MMAELTNRLASTPSTSAPSEMNVVSQNGSLQHSKPKLSRTSTHKVRTGCITCKKRHIRCDEARPHCSNCLKSRGHCEGYVAEPKKKMAPGFVQFCWDARRVAHDEPPKMPLQLNPDSIDFRDDTSMLYFQEFVGLVQGPWTSAASSGDLWGVTLPQLTRSNSTLRFGAMAIGALSMWHSQRKYDSLRAVSVPTLPSAEGDVHYFRAIAYYCHSLRLQSRQAHVQDAVFLSLLLLFFEILRGNRKVALDHVNHGLAMIFALLAGRDASLHLANFAPNPKPLLGAVADVFVQMATQTRVIIRGQIGHGPALPNLAKGLKNNQQTMESFMILLSQLSPASTTIGCIPAAFNNLDEFEEHWMAVRRSQTDIAPIVSEIVQSSGISGSQDEAIIKDFQFDLFNNPRIESFCSARRERLQSLDTAFLPLFNNILMSTAPESPSYLRALHLRLQLLGAIIFNYTPAFFSSTNVHARTPLFREYLTLTRAALHAAKHANTNPAHQASLQCDVAWYLLTTSFYCRDALVRDEAACLLQDYPGQDGLWSTRALHALAVRNRDVIERANAVEGTEEEQWQRLWRREFVFEEGGERVVLRYMERDARTGVWGIVEEVGKMPGEEGGEVRWIRQGLTGSAGLLTVNLHDV